MELYYKGTAGFKAEELESVAERLSEYQEYLNKILGESSYDAHECSVNLPIDQNFISLVKETKKKKISKDLKYFVVIGIGGSNLGTKAIYDALYGFFDPIDPGHFPKLLFLETTNPQQLEQMNLFLEKNIKNPEEILFNVISKSGTTTETIANFEIVGETFKKKFGEQSLVDRMVVTTDENSKLWKVAKAKNFTLLPIPEKVGGRYSVFSTVGLFPLISIGIDTESLCEGAATMRKICIENALEQNPALQSAILLFLNLQAGKIINDNFFFAPQLESLGKWYRQLMGESIGKETDLDGNAVHTGITPTVSLGSTDLHSLGQLYLGGPLDKFTTFISVRNVEDPVNIPIERITGKLVENLDHKNAEAVMGAILDGTKTAYAHKKLPYMEIVMPEISAFALGEFLQFKMIEMMYLGKLMNVNTFDQPNVELYKIETRKILGRK